MNLLRCLLLLLCVPPVAAALPTGTALDGSPVSPWDAAQDAIAVVLVFVAPDCPISNRYAPTFVRLAADCANRNMALWLVYADDHADPTLIRQAQKEFGLTDISTVIDRTFAFADFADAKVTPEAAVFVRPTPGAEPRRIYLGRIDDQYQGYNSFRPAATQSELRTLLDQIAAGKTPAPVRTKAIGCYIPRR